MAAYSSTSTMPKNSSEVPRSRSRTSTPTESPHATSSGARSRARGSSMPRNRRPAVVNSSRFCTRNAAKNTISRILANSPGWMPTRAEPDPQLRAVDLGDRRGQQAGQRQQHEADEPGGVGVAGERAVVADQPQHRDEQHQPDRRPRDLPVDQLGRSARRPARRRWSDSARSSRWIITRPSPLSSATHGRISGSAYGANRRTARCATVNSAEVGQPDEEQRLGAAPAPGWPRPAPARR